MPNMKLLCRSNDVIIDDFIYARESKSSENIELLVEKLKAGITLEPIEVQQVSNYGDGNEDAILLINGGHRLDAYEEYNKLKDMEKFEPRFVAYKDEALDYGQSKVVLAARSHNANDEQGLNSRPKDTRKIARNIALSDESLEQKDIAVMLNRTAGLISKYVGDIFAQRMASRHVTIMRLSTLGWTQEAIGEVVGLDRVRITQIVNKFTGEEIYNFHSSGKSIEQIAEMLDIDQQTVWHYLLKALSDDDKFAMLDENLDGFNINPHYSDVMNYSKCLSLTGVDGYAGQIPGQIVMNELYFFTEPSDLVIDPMAGGGTTLDACMLLNRRCLGFDKKSTRSDIIENDITGDIPKTKKADLVFLDPPYFIKKAEEYDLPEALRSREGFMDFAKHWVRFCRAVLKPSGYVALLISNYKNYEDDSQSIFSYEYARLFEQSGFALCYAFSYPLTTQQYDAHAITTAREEKRRLIRDRNMYILRRKN